MTNATKSYSSRAPLGEAAAGWWLGLLSMKSISKFISPDSPSANRAQIPFRFQRANHTYTLCQPHQRLWLVTPWGRLSPLSTVQLPQISCYFFAATPRSCYFPVL